MRKKKAVFFDIDGTLWNIKNEIPVSAKEAIIRLRKNGNLAFFMQRALQELYPESGFAGAWL